MLAHFVSYVRTVRCNIWQQFLQRTVGLPRHVSGMCACVKFLRVCFCQKLSKLDEIW